MGKAHTVEEQDIFFQEIINQISEGKSLRAALKMNGHSSKKFYEWIEDDNSRKKQYARACEERANSIFEDTLEIADEVGYDMKVSEDGRKVVDHEAIQRSKLRVDTRKWMLGKLNPKKYGDKTDITTGGEKINTVINLGEGKKP